MPSEYDWRPFVHPETGQWFNGTPAYFRWRTDETGYDILRTQDAQPIIDDNVRQQTAGNNGYTADREFQHVARIPMTEVYRWIVEEGWDMRDPNASDKLTRRLNDGDWYKLRTGLGRI